MRPPKIAAVVFLALGRLFVWAGPPRSESPEAERVLLVVNGHQITDADLQRALAADHGDKILEGVVVTKLAEKELERAGLRATPEEAQAGFEQTISLIRKTQPRYQQVTTREILEDLLLEEAELRQQIALQQGILKLLVRRGDLPPGLATYDPEAQQAMQNWKKKLLADHPLLTDPEKLPTGEYARAGGVPIRVSEVAHAVRQWLRPKAEEEAAQVLRQLTALCLVEAELAKRQVRLGPTDYQQALEDLKLALALGADLDPPTALQVFLRRRGMDDRQYLQSREFRLRAGAHKLAALELSEDQVRETFHQNPQKFGHDDPDIAHIYLAVLDQDGQPFGARKTGIAAVDQAYQARREEAFAAGKARALEALAAARKDFARAARQYSDDPATKHSGGRLGFVNRQRTIRPPLNAHLVDRARETEPGKIFGPVRSPLGWHLVQVLGRRQLTYDSARPTVRAVLRHENATQLVTKLLEQAKIETPAAAPPGKKGGNQEKTP